MSQAGSFRPTLAHRIGAKLAYMHAQHVSAGFFRSLTKVRERQQRALDRALRTVAGSGWARDLGLNGVRSAEDFRRTAPLTTYERVRPYVERVAAGESTALFAAGVDVLMFASSSGTTAQAKLIPVTPQFVADYRRGWLVFGLKMLLDHPEAILRPILQGSGRMDSQRSPAGIPIGAITGLLARTQKQIVRRYYVGVPEIAELATPRERYYTLMRLGAAQDVAFAITANPATLIEMAKVASEESERLIRDVHDGTLCPPSGTEHGLSQRLGAQIRPNRERAAQLSALRRAREDLRPRDFWRLSFIGCWTGGSMSHYLPRLREWYGQVPIRDLGLLASEGRISIPLLDNTPVGVLDVDSAFFEFVPEGDAGDQPQTLLPHELETGRCYEVVLSNSAGLVRYRLADMVRVHGFEAGAPLIEFLYRGGRVASIAGEKLTENQVVNAVATICRGTGISMDEFVVAPVWGDPPFYQLSCEADLPPGFDAGLDRALMAQNGEYAERRQSNRLGPPQLRRLPNGSLSRTNFRQLQQRGGFAEQFKRTCLYLQPGDDDRALAG